MQLWENDSNLEGAVNVVVTGCWLQQVFPFCTAVMSDTSQKETHESESVCSETT